jgi:ribosomal protein L40E
MILYEKTVEVKGYDVKEARAYDKICVKCDECDKEYEKISRDLPAWNGRCASCIGKIRGKMMGDKFGKTQKVKGKCASCGDPVRTSLKYCSKDSCQILKAERMSARSRGSSNPAWTGKHVCECGKKKSHGAKMCRSCSFSSGLRSSVKNGRFISNDRDFYLECVKARKMLSGIMANVCKSGGITKNKNKTTEMLGYSWKEFKEHIEAQFNEDMSWSNYGREGWSIDHILPVDWFIKNKVFDVKIVNSLRNLRPLNHKVNMRKSNQIEIEDPWLLYEELKSAIFLR